LDCRFWIEWRVTRTAQSKIENRKSKIVMRLRATVAYDGTEFFGFQRQASARTVQGEIETALEKVTGRQTGVTGAGRTDAGVHATGQVIAFDADWRHGMPALTKALNITLPDDVAVRALAECSADFHPRFDAQSRTYEYTVLVSEVRQPLMRRTAWQLNREPDLAAMNRAAAQLVGSHDFAAFGSAPSGRNEETTVRDVVRAAWQARGCEALVFTIEANAFLFRMVRRLALALVRVGLGQSSADNLKDILESRDAQRIKGLAPACGLCLVDVKY
jgi:tRNA pseudouridine38-40 synthase